MDALEIGRRLRTLRANLPRETVANACGISRSALGMYERGKRIPRDNVKLKLANFYGVSVESIFFD